MSAPNTRRPWPMKWIVLAIVVVLVPYTYLTLRYRKPGPAFQPYQDMKNRANVSRLLSAGFQRIPLPAQGPTESVRPAERAEPTRVAGGLPAELKSTLVETPQLPLDIVEVLAPRAANTLQAYPIQFTCTVGDDKQQLGGADLYVREDTLVIAPTFERIGGELLTRTRQPTVLVTVPAGALKQGQYRVTIAGQRTSQGWSLEVR